MSKQKLIVYKITLAGFLIALSVIFQRFLVIPFGVPSFYRISLGNIPIMMGSLFIGPLFGMIVGVTSDLTGALIWPTGTLLIWPTITAAAYGILPGLFLKAIRFFNKKVKVPFFYIFIAILFTVIELFIFLNDSVRSPYVDSSAPRIVFTSTFRIVFTIIFALLLIVVAVAIGYLEKRFKGKVATTLTGSPSELAFAILLSLLIIDIFYSSTWKYLLWNIDFFVSVFFHTLIGLILLPTQTTLLIITSRIFERQSYLKVTNNSKTTKLATKEDEETKNDEN